MPPVSPKGRAPTPEAAESSLAEVRLEVRAGTGRITAYDVGDGGFLIGTVPGCDVRLPGANLPPVLCLIARTATGASLRRLAPVQPILVNGKAIASTYLNPGDRVSVGGVEVVVSVTPGRSPFVSATAPPPENYDEREKKLRQAREELENERIVCQQRSQEMEAETRRKVEALQQVVQRLQGQEQELLTARADLEAREKAWRASQEELFRQRTETEGLAEEARKRHEEATELRGQLTEIRQQLSQRYHERRDRLLAHQQSVRRAARRLQERKQRLDAAEAELKTRQEEWHQRQIEIEGRAEQIERERQLLDEQHRLIVSRQQEVQRDLTERFNEVQVRETKLGRDEEELQNSQKQHQADLLRLDRIQATLEQRQKQLQERALEVDRGFEQLQRDTRDLEEQASQLDEWHNRLITDTEQLAEQKKEQENVVSQLEQRAAALEGQQAMLATLRTRLERMREELRKQEQSLSDQRMLQEATEADLRDRLNEAERMRAELESDRELHQQEQRRFQEHRATLEGAVAQLRQAREALESEESQVRQQQDAVQAAAAEQSEQAALLAARTTQLEALQEQVNGERAKFRDREVALARAEQALAALQEQVRRRVEELNDRQRQQTMEEQRLQEEADRLAEQARLAGQDQQLAEERLNLLRQELADRTAVLDEQARRLSELEERLRTEQGCLEEAQTAVGGQRQVLASERIAWEVERQKAKDEDKRRLAELEASRQELTELGQQLPELETRASAALERLLQARGQLREHLNEVHTYVRESRADLETMRKDFQAEVERVRQQELDLHVARDEHRITVAAFRQKVAEWQGHIAEMKQALQQGETLLDRRAAEVQEQAQQIADTSARLAQQAEHLQEQERLVSERRGQVESHLNDMREWYRRKMRELAGLDTPVAAEGEEAVGSERGILSLTGEVDAGDRQLGDLLRSLELVDADTLTALLMEARRQRRSLRQLLLAGNYLTLYQMALIEAGNLDGLVLGPVRVIDRLQATPREAVYRVFDPRRGGEALLRHLAESEMQDAVRPDEFRQRFAAAAAVQHPNVAATLEVLDIGARPAVLQEWLHGLPSTEWPPVASAPGVWYRLFAQAAVALHAIHSAGLVHGHLHAASFVVTPEGVLKLCGLGEPRWLAMPAPQGDGEPSVLADLMTLGHLARSWAEATPTGKNTKVKPLPKSLQAILQRFQDGQADCFVTAAELLEALDQARPDVPANPTAWERFVRQVREESAVTVLRESA
jgi:chromosome segregation ATPase